MEADITTNDEKLVRRAHEAFETLRQVIKGCLSETTDEDHEDMYVNALGELRDAKAELPTLPEGEAKPAERW